MVVVVVVVVEVVMVVVLGADSDGGSGSQWLWWWCMVTTFGMYSSCYGAFHDETPHNSYCTCQIMIAPPAPHIAFSTRTTDGISVSFLSLSRITLCAKADNYNYIISNDAKVSMQIWQSRNL